MSKVVWSYSSLSTFKSCPKKYYHLKVLKDYKDEGNEATLYGELVHKAAENFIKDGTEIPEQFKYLRKPLEVLAALPGAKYCELKLGVAKTSDSFQPRKFFDKDVWWRGIADLVIIDGDRAWSIDYKTSKNARYADTKQLDAVAAAIFTHFPQVKVIKSALLFVVSGDLIAKTHYAEDKEKYFGAFSFDLSRLERAQDTGVWNANPSGLCKKYCPVLSCPHNGRSS